VCQKRHRECRECAGRQIGVFGITTRGRYLVNLSKICSVGCCCRGRVQRACCVEHNSCGGSYFIFIIRRLYDEIAFKYFEHPEGRGTRQLSTHTPALFLLTRIHPPDKALKCPAPLLRVHIHLLPAAAGAHYTDTFCEFSAGNYAFVYYVSLRPGAVSDAVLSVFIIVCSSGF